MTKLHFNTETYLIHYANIYVTSDKNKTFYDVLTFICNFKEMCFKSFFKRMFAIRFYTIW